jgi:hypothetical protein
VNRKQIETTAEPDNPAEAGFRFTQQSLSTQDKGLNTRLKKIDIRDSK